MRTVVTVYDPDERMMGWYHYLKSQLRFPFRATCAARRVVSPLRIKDEVEVVGMPDNHGFAEIF